MFKTKLQATIRLRFTINAIKYIYHKLSHFCDFKVKLLSAKSEATSVFVL